MIKEEILSEARLYYQEHSRLDDKAVLNAYVDGATRNPWHKNDNYPQLENKSDKYIEAFVLVNRGTDCAYYMVLYFSPVAGWSTTTSFYSEHLVDNKDIIRWMYIPSWK